MKKIYIIHENSDWTIHLTNRLTELGLPFEELHMAEGLINLSSVPPTGVYYNRMSASSHTRGHRYAPELTSGLLAWLSRHNQPVFNGCRALQLELSKVLQYLELNKFGIQTPKTIAATGKAQIVSAAEKFGVTRMITKHNRAGKGLGVQLFNDFDSLQNYVYSDQFEEPIDGITLIQEYIESPDASITRCEFVGGKFVYAVRVDTSEGFELCPADACQIGDLFCPVGEEVEEKPKFEIIENFDDPIIDLYEAFLEANDIHVAGIEFIRNKEGVIYTYDVNTNTNYNSDAEEKAGKYGMLELAKFLGKELQKVRD
ncbi:ATP-grasp domain-containing protein [Bacillus suaedaesalsae]|uniref:Alpha-L-glutamate ligase n=1 Tax=Bacillus suaedaesalsae TaxID=2810349 RepID=A0ABS2DK50_9BACI|nr:alpha-L-glutamate ligase [Bacillus suaedaesalsae]MBM6618792.1 alpha-L-glutamate ligase [Bacillus suaedaesalsae]